MSPRDTNSAARQALSDQHKEAVKSWVPKVRRVLEEEFAAQLDRLGLKPDGKHMPTEKMRLSEEVIRTRRRVEALLRRDAIAESSTQRGFDNVVRELAYTLLNRLVGLKAMEARALLYLPPPRDPEGTPEQTEVLTPIPGQAYSRYLRDFRLGWVYQFFNREEEEAHPRGEQGHSPLFLRARRHQPVLYALVGREGASGQHARPTVAPNAPRFVGRTEGAATAAGQARVR